MSKRALALLAVLSCAALPARADFVIVPGTYTQTYSAFPTLAEGPEFTLTNEGTFEVPNSLVAIQVQGSGGSVGAASPSLTFDSTGSIAATVSINPAGTTFLAANVVSRGNDGASSIGGMGGPITASISAPVSLTMTAASPALSAYGFFAQTLGGQGAAGGSNGAQAGGAGGNVSVSVSNTSVTLEAQGGTPGAALFAGQVGGAGGAAAGGNGAPGGAGGAAEALNLTLDAAQVSTSGDTRADAVMAAQVGGAGGVAAQGSSDSSRSKGGQGGTTGLLTGSVTDSTISSIGGRGLVLQQTGGVGGNGNLAPSNNDFSDGFTGGSTGGISLTLNQATTGTTIATAADNAPGALALATGGAGGTGGTAGGGLEDDVGAGNGGAGGNASGDQGQVLVQSTGTLVITTQGKISPGIAAIGQGGLGGTAGNVVCATDCHPGAGGSGGRGDPVAVNLGAGASITTAGQQASAVAAQSLGANGGAAGGAEDEFGAEGVTGATSGYGGNSGPVTVNLASGATLTTTGTQSPALLVQSIGGQGGSSGTATQITADVGQATGTTGGAGGDAGAASVTSGATIVTSGQSSWGILVQVTSGPGGQGGQASGLQGTTGGSGGVPGTDAGAMVANSGAITTGGAGAQGILVQAIAGAGGAGGSGSGFITSRGGSANFANANGGPVTITNTGTVATAGAVAAAIVGQSVGGSGGDGGPSSGVFYSQGGSAGGGGNGGALAVNLGGSLATLGVLSHGVLAQSIGGTGGTGGNAVAQGTVATYVVGGSAGTGGAGGTVAVTAIGAQVQLQGSGANGIVAQSIGGGGGAGGAAYALDVGNSFAFASAIGGSGGNGGSGGSVTVTTGDTTISTGRPAAAVPTLPVDAIGILAQSVSGGGGVGGGASAAAVAIGLPSPPETKSVAITVTDAVGGTGGSGGSANGTVTATLQDSTSVTTAGAGSIGVLAQSIGGGGGQGGDSSTFSATIGSSNKYVSASAGTAAFQINFALGATGGSGGSGGAVTVSLGNAAGAVPGGTVIVGTTGDYADGILAQSIGGGGGNAGAGSSQMYATGAGSSVKFSLDLGAQGGVGGSGGNVTLNLYPESSVQTQGSGAAGVLTQSIGGGGGNSTGGTVSLIQLLTQETPVPKMTESLNPTLGLGATGGAGNNGGGITALAQGSITTVGDDAPGLLLQSIGGGGGVGGSPGQDAAPGGDKTETAGAVPSAQNDLSIGSLTVEQNVALSVGGTGGTAGNGGTIMLTQQGSVQTSGDYSPGVIAQSIGGGGGRGGTALVGTQDNSLTSVIAELSVNSDTSLGMNGSGGGGGTGGAVTLSLNGATIRTGVAGQGSTGTGFQSFGVLAQSIGAGGGTAADGTSGPSGNARIGSGAVGASGDGGSITIQQTGGSANTISTTGDFASGVVAQSIGGGGGVFGAGSSAPVTNTFYTGNVNIQLGSATTSATGNGGNVAFNFPSLTITTTGKAAFGVLAQSIGAGGGLAAVGGAATVTGLGAVSGATGNGGAVTVDLASAGSITTSGAGAHGVIAQSIGGGGGVALLPTTGVVPTVTTTRTGNLVSNSFGTGGAVTVATHAPIIVTGDGAFAILAQSVNGGGGLVTVAPGTVIAGSVNGGGASSESTGNVSVTTQGNIEATGQNGVAIFAQSAQGPYPAEGSVTVLLQGGLSGSTVEGGSGPQGYGVWVDGGNPQNEITNDVSLSALSGMAINYTGEFGVNVQNNGTLSGSSNLGSGTLTNNGIMNVAGPPAAGPYYGQATLRGNLVQTASGRIMTDVDFASARAGQLVVTGNAALGGKIVPNAATVLPNVNVPVLIVDGTVTGTIQGSQSTLFAYDTHDPPSEITLSARSLGFAPAGFGIRGAAAEVAGHLQHVFDTATAPDLGTLFATLGTLADAGAGGYIGALQQLSPGSVLAFASRARAETAAFGDALLRCQSFVGASAITTETGCGWMEVSGGAADQGNGGGYAGFTDSTVNYRIGGQTWLAPGWVLGGALGYSHSWLDGEFNATGEGDAGYAGVNLTREWQGWRFSAAVFGSFGSNSTSRTVTIPGFASVLTDRPDVDTEAARLRADYTFGVGRAYIRPSMTVDVVRVHAGAFNGSGQKTVALAFDDSALVSGIFAPQVEFGLRTDLQGGTALRSYLTLGASLPTSSRFRQPVRLEGAALAAGNYDATIPTDGAAATIGVGVQLFTDRDFDVRLEYDGAFSGRVTDNTGMLVGALHF